MAENTKVEAIDLAFLDLLDGGGKEGAPYYACGEQVAVGDVIEARRNLKLKRVETVTSSAIYTESGKALDPKAFSLFCRAPHGYDKADTDRDLVAAARRVEALEAENERLREGLDDAINQPMGVVPDSALPFWDGRAGCVARLRLTRIDAVIAGEDGA